MPFAQIDDVLLHYDVQGGQALPCLVFSNSLGTDLGMWDRQSSALADAFRVVRYDTRGHGRSGNGAGPVDIARLGRDVVGLLDHLGIRQAHFCGISMGGLTGQWLGIHAPERLGKLVLANTAARIGSADAWHARAALVRRAGMHEIAAGAAGRWFTEPFIGREPDVVASMIATLRDQDAEGYAACCDALAHGDLCASVSAISRRTLVIAGAADPVTTVADARWLVREIADAALATLPASHLSNIEAAPAFNRVLRQFLLD
ncbi:MAG: 3-oxoadipate enol-lactonase [Massilia sp.]